MRAVMPPLIRGLTAADWCLWFLMLKKPGFPAAAILVALQASPVRAEVTVIEPVADTSLFQWTDDYNFGAQVDLPAGGLGGPAGDERLARALFKFDIAAAVPAQLADDKLGRFLLVHSTYLLT